MQSTPAMIEMPGRHGARRATHFYARMLACERLNPSVVRLRLAPERGARLLYREGQYLSITLPDGDVRAYSMAAPASEDGALELHIRLHAAGKFSTLLREGLLERTRLRVDGPFGDCCWQAPVSSAAPILMLATGTGIAPLNALLEAALRDGCVNPLTLYWGGPRPDDFYLAERFHAWSRRYPNFHFVPVLAGEQNMLDHDPLSEAWQGARGRVEQLASQRHGDLTDAHVYACGAPTMVAAARELLIAVNQLAPERFLADVFEPSNAAAPISPVAESAVRPPTLPTSSASPLTTPLDADAAKAMLEIRVEAGGLPPVALPLPAGISLMEGLRAARLIQGVCGGKQSCGTCRVRVSAERFACLPPARRAEQRLLSVLEHSGPHDRLACQLMLAPALDGLVLQIPSSDE